ncbi:MAG TPA: lyase, partial [Methylomirabilota bacterium]|nr:lyase [Methylomirabilota bacterium]
TKGQGARRVWSDSHGRIWVSEWNSGQVSLHDPGARGASQWRAWKLPGDSPRTYAVYVDDKDMVWLSEWTANAVVRFDPEREKFDVFPSDKRGANVRQILGRPGEVWTPESGADRLVVYRTR